MSEVKFIAENALSSLNNYCNKGCHGDSADPCEFCPISKAQEMLREEASDKICISAIDWDIDEEDDAEALDLPESITVSVVKLENHGVTSAEQIADYLSDEYGFCVRSYDVENDPWIHSLSYAGGD